jgi:hypothetical protein
MRIFAPNAFNPNDNGMKDTFTTFMDGGISKSLSIFNRWENPIFKNTDPQWDG